MLRKASCWQVRLHLKNFSLLILNTYKNQQINQNHSLQKESSVLAVKPPLRGHFQKTQKRFTPSIRYVKERLDSTQVPPSPPLQPCHVPAHPQPITHFLPTPPSPPPFPSFSADYHWLFVRHLLISRPPHYIAPLCPPRLTLSPTINQHKLLLLLWFFLPAFMLASANVDPPQDPLHAILTQHHLIQT